MGYETIKLDNRDGTAILTLNRPDKLNSVTMTMRAEIIKVLGELEADENVRVVVVTGEGRAFCAGADVNEFAEGAKNPELQNTINSKLLEMARVFYEFEKPVIGAINGAVRETGPNGRWPLI